MSYRLKEDRTQKDVYHYVNGKFMLDRIANVSVLDLGLLRGYGVFDYIQVYDGVPFHLTDHLIRLQQCSEKIQIDCPETLDDLHKIVYEMIEKNEIVNGGIRLLITGGTVSADLLLPGEASTLIALYHPYAPLPEHYYSKGMRVITTSMTRLLPTVKTLNYIPAVLAGKEAKKRGYDDALYLNSEEEILEGTTSNAFFFKNGTWITAGPEEIINGITRLVAIELIKQGYPIEFRSLKLSEIASCEEAFLCSSMKDMVPLVEINDQKIGSGLPGKHTEKLREAYRRYIDQYCANVAAFSIAASI